MAKNDVYVANTTFSTDLDGAAVVVHKGNDRVRGDHPLYLQCPELFDPITDHVRFDVETAAATPGEDRGGAQSGVQQTSAAPTATVSDPVPSSESKPSKPAATKPAGSRK